MFNLLPQEEQKVIAREYRLRLADVALLFLSALAAVACIALIPSLVQSYLQEGAVSKREAAVKAEIAESATGDFSKALKLASKKVAVLTEATSTSYSYEFISDIIQDKSADVKILGITIKRADSGNRDVTIIGKAKDREALLAFKQILERDKNFTAVSVPPSNFASAADISFSITAKTN